MNTISRTYTGRNIDLANPRAEDIDIVDIGMHLSQINRYCGACPFPYSVAQHSVMLTWILPAPLRKWGLAHDWAEAYKGDKIKPAKPFCPGDIDLEERIQRVICEKFGLSWPEPPEVKAADNAIYALEKYDLLYWRDMVGELPESVRGMKIEPMEWWEARELFMETYYDLWFETRKIRYEDGTVFFSGRASEAYRHLRRTYGQSVTFGAMESGIIPFFTTPGIKAA